MKLIISLALFFILLGSAFAENKIEFHGHHENLLSHSTKRMQSEDSPRKNDQDKSETTTDCHHYQVHCSSLCLGLLYSNQQSLQVSSYLIEFGFNQVLLLVKDFSISLYRPPILGSV